jgi:hypothetical protein
MQGISLSHKTRGKPRRSGMYAPGVTGFYPPLNRLVDMDAFLLVFHQEFLRHFKAELFGNKAGYAG